MIKTRILAPLINANEPQAQVVEVHVEEQDQVNRLDIICVVETTKSVVEVETPEGGYVRQLSVSTGDTVTAGDLICIISDSVDAPIKLPNQPDLLNAKQEKSSHEGFLITAPARRLAQELNVDLYLSQHEGVITESVIREMSGNNSEFDLSSNAEFNMKLLVFGGGGHGKSIIELIQQQGVYQIAGIVDDGLSPGTLVSGISVLGSRNVLPKIWNDGIRLAVNAVGGTTSISARMKVFHELAEACFTFPVLVHPKAVVEPSALLEDGVQVFANAYVGSDAVVRQGSIVNTGAIVSHDCVIGSYAHVAPNVALAGGCKIGEKTLIGMGVTTAVGIEVGSNVRVGNSSVLNDDVPDGIVVRAGTTWPGEGS